MNPYGIDLSKNNLQGPLISLEVLYENMPATSGCENCEKTNGISKKDWCCLEQNPSMFYVEFLKVFKKVGDTWDNNKKTELLLRAIRNYLSNSLTKGCIFYDNGCQCYEDRPLACRLYGVIPKESWDKRWESLKKRQGDKFEAKPQCSLVSAEREVTVEAEEKWFAHTVICEGRIGISQSILGQHDLGGGSYRTFHDHLLLEMLGDEVMSTLSQVRLTDPSGEDIDKTIEFMREFVNGAISS